jgi:hypothetical protein
MESYGLAPAGWMLDLVRASFESLVLRIDAPHRSSLATDPDLAAASTLVLLGVAAFVFGKLAPRHPWLDRATQPAADRPPRATARVHVGLSGRRDEGQDLAHPREERACPVSLLIRAHAGTFGARPIPPRVPGARSS